jgi:diguanylate cyclase (GGDEF)-like protein
MKKTPDAKDCLGSSDVERFGKVIDDIHNADNLLLEEFTHLSECFNMLRLQVNKLSAENEQLKTELVNMVRSLDLASRIDGMTGLANRRDIMEKIDREATRSQRHQRSFTILLVNIDDFKKVNDLYTYNAGDDVLVEVARVLRSCVRNEDICARWGGDEFLILLPETSVENSLPVACKVLEAMSMTEFKANKPGIRITVSIGVCEHQPAQTVQGTISRVHQALLMAKKGGKNRYIITT